MESNNQQQQEEEDIDLFNIKKLEISPETSPISAAVSFKIHFTLTKHIAHPIIWKVYYIIDYTGKRVINELYKSEKYQYASGLVNGEEIVNEIELHTPAMDEQISQVPRKTLLNVGLLQIKAFQLSGDSEEEGSEEVLSMNMVVHVSKDKQDESQLMKAVLNPLE
eukprot:403361105